MSQDETRGLRALVADSVRFRGHFDPKAIHGRDVVVSGRERDWASASEPCRRAALRIVGYHDVRGKVDSGEYQGVPVLTGQQVEALGDTPVLFAGLPKKLDFMASPPALMRCQWLVPPPGRKQDGKKSPTFLDDNAAALGQVASMLADDWSRRTLASIVRSRLEGDTGYYLIADHIEYQHPIAKAVPGDVVIDGGAYNGDSSTLFARQVGPEGRVFALEPSHDNFTALCEASANGFGQIVPLCQGLWSEPAILKFIDGEGASSQISPEGTKSIAVTSIDTLVAQFKLQRVDLVKLDVEGAEEAALSGARRTLQTLRPKVHLSIYHKLQDLVELPLLLKEWLPNYRFWLGHHNYYHTETDLYAVPEERLPAVS